MTFLKRLLYHFSKNISTEEIWCPPTTCLLLLGALAMYLYYKINKQCNYFLVRGIPHVKAIHSIKGNLKMLLSQETVEENFGKIYNSLKDYRLGGFFMFLTPVFMIRDPELIEKMLITDFSHFSDHGGKVDIKTNPLDGNLFNLKGQNWKVLRSKLNSIFTNIKLKSMFEQITILGDKLVNNFSKIATGEDVEYKKTLSAYGIDVIASCSFGMDAQSLNDPNSKFLEITSKLLKPSLLERIIAFGSFFFPKIAALLKIRRIPTDTTEFFVNITKNSMLERVKSNDQRKDFVQILIQLKQQGLVDFDDEEEIDKLNLKNKKSNKYEFTYEVLAAQSFAFFVAGLEASTNLLAYSLYLLSIHPNVQDKLRKEIKQNIDSNGGVTFEGLKKMVYLDCILSETLRLYPSIPFLIRECTKTYTIEESVTIEKHNVIFIPVESLHYDEQYFEEPDKFIPERFIDSKYSIRQSHGIYLPFGDGPRVCMARRFALLETKIALVKILISFELERSPKNKEHLKKVPCYFGSEPKGGLFIRIKQIKQVKFSK